MLGLNDFVSINKISERLDVSERTVRYDLDTIEEYLKHLKCSMLRKPRFGILLSCDEDKREKLLHSIMDFNSRVFSPQEREFLIIIYILSKESTMTVEKLSALLSVSKNTIIADLAYVDKKLKAYNLNLNKKTY